MKTYIPLINSIDQNNEKSQYLPFETNSTSAAWFALKGIIVK